MSLPTVDPAKVREFGFSSGELASLPRWFGASGGLCSGFCAVVAPLAQLVEQRTFNPLVQGSIP